MVESQALSFADLGGGSSYDMNALLEISRNNAIAAGNLVKQTTINTKQLELHSRQLDEIRTTVDDLSSRMDERENSEMVSPSQRKAILRAISKRVYELIGVRRTKKKLDGNDKKIRKVYGDLFFSRLHAYLWRRFDVGSYEEIKAIDYDTALSCIKTWEPDDGISGLKAEAEENWAVNHPEIDVDTYLGRLSL